VGGGRVLGVVAALLVGLVVVACDAGDPIGSGGLTYRFDEGYRLPVRELDDGGGPIVLSRDVEARRLVVGIMGGDSQSVRDEVSDVEQRGDTLVVRRALPSGGFRRSIAVAHAVEVTGFPTADLPTQVELRPHPDAPGPPGSSGLTSSIPLGATSTVPERPEIGSDPRR
jgi:hypothetical protein